MKAILLERNGGPEVLTIREIPEPLTIEGSVKIKVKAFGLNRIEVFQRSGIIGPLTRAIVPGIEAAGEVVEDRSGKFKIGQKVVTLMGGMGMTRQGSYAEYIVSPSDNVLSVNTPISYEELAAVPESFGTVGVALDKDLGIKAGETLLIRGGTSAVGIAALLYAKIIGLKVISTTRNQNKSYRLKELGADYVLVDDGHVSNEVRKIFPGGVDKAIEIVGASTLSDTIASVKSFGHVAMIGLLGGPPVIREFNLMDQLGENVKLSFSKSGVVGTKHYRLEETPINLIAESIVSGKMRSLRTKTFLIHEISDAHRFMESDRADGKIVIVI